MIKLLKNAGASIALLLFLALIGEDCLHWYALPLSRSLHRSLFAGMVLLLSLNCLQLLRNLMKMRRVWEKAILNLASVPAGFETKVEAIMRYSSLSVLSALCFYAFAAAWGSLYLCNGPIVGTGYVALLVFIAYDITAVIAGVKVQRLQCRLKSRRIKPQPE